MRISKLSASQRKKGRILVQLENGDILRVGESEVVSHGLYAGMELDGAVLSSLEEAARKREVRERAMDLLSLRPMSRRELTDKLTAKGADPQAAEEAADWLEEKGLLDDEDYARALVRHYAQKGYGLYRIRQELYRRGVPQDFWDAAAEEAPGPEEGILNFLRKKWDPEELEDPRNRKKASDALARRGYRWEDIGACLRAYCGMGLE